MKSDRNTEKARQIISENIYMTVATASADGKPWISPVFFNYDDKYNLYWVSNKNSRHSKLIQDNPQAAIVIFDSRAREGEGDGVYFEASIEILSERVQIDMAIEVLNKRVTHDEFKIKRIEEVTGSGVWRIYKAVPIKISKLTEGEFINGQYVDKRVDIEL